MKKTTPPSGFYLGMKVIPHSKSIYSSLGESSVWKRAQRDNQNFLYVVGWGEEGPESLTLDNVNEDGGGDFFHISDVTPYLATSYICIKSYPGVEKGQIFKAPFQDENMFGPEFFRPQYPFPKLTIEGYDVNFDSESETINWGCREFSLDEFKHIVETFKIMNDKDLYLGVGRKSDLLTFAPYSILSQILNWIEDNKEIKKLLDC